MNISNTLHKALRSEESLLNENYKIEKQENSFIVASKNGRVLHSKYNIENECKRALSSVKNNKNLVIIYGFGLGYIVKYLIENFNDYFEKEVIESLKIIVVVEDSALFKYSYYNMKNPSKENIFFIHHNDDVKYVSKIIDYKSVNGISLVLLPSLTKEEKEKANNFYSSVLNDIERYFSDLFTNMYFENIWTKNVIFNSEYIASSSDISSFKNVFRGFNALLICAGPTLNECIEKIKKEAKNVVIIAVDTAYSILSKNGIMPDFIVTVDGGFFNSLDFVYEKNKFPYLVMDIICSSLIAKNIKERTSMIMFNSTKTLGIIEHLKRTVNISPLITVNTAASTMIDFASYAGFNKVLLVGFDNSYPFYERHAKHALSYEYNINKTDKLNTIESLYFKSIKENANINEYPPTDFVFENQIEYFKTLKDRYENIKIMRITSKAIKIDCIEEGGLEDIVLNNSHKKALKIAKEMYKKNNGKDIKIIYENINKSLEDFKSKIIVLYEESLKNSETENIKNIYKKSLDLIKEYEKIIPILKTVLSTTVIMIKRSDRNILSKLTFLLNETIKNTNYFHTRISLLINRL